jgi:hypothetical protein
MPHRLLQKTPLKMPSPLRLQSRKPMHAGRGADPKVTLTSKPKARKRASQKPTPLSRSILQSSAVILQRPSLYTSQTAQVRPISPRQTPLLRRSLLLPKALYGTRQFRCLFQRAPKTGPRRCLPHLLSLISRRQNRVVMLRLQSSLSDAYKCPSALHWNPRMVHTVTAFVLHATSNILKVHVS